MWRGEGNRTNTCFREGITELRLYSYRNSTHYFINSQFSRFRNNNLRDNAESLFDYEWTLDSIASGNTSNSRTFPAVFNA